MSGCPKVKLSLPAGGSHVPRTLAAVFTARQLFSSVDSSPFSASLLLQLGDSATSGKRRYRAPDRTVNDRIVKKLGPAFGSYTRDVTAPSRRRETRSDSCFLRREAPSKINSAFD